MQPDRFKGGNNFPVSRSRTIEGGISLQFFAATPIRHFHRQFHIGPPFFRSFFSDMWRESLFSNLFAADLTINFFLFSLIQAWLTSRWQLNFPREFSTELKFMTEKTTVMRQQNTFFNSFTTQDKPSPQLKYHDCIFADDQLVKNAARRFSLFSKNVLFLHAIVEEVGRALS